MLPFRITVRNPEDLTRDITITSVEVSKKLSNDLFAIPEDAQVGEESSAREVTIAELLTMFILPRTSCRATTRCSLCTTNMY
jgi:hypothetical protein